MKIDIADCSKTDKHQYEINLLLKTIKHTDALTTDESRFSDFFEVNKKDFPVKLRAAIKKLAKSYNTTISLDDKIADVAERMYNYRPF
jgi:hypothetical protein